MPRINGVIVPNVNLNGTSKEELVNQRRAARDALRKALSRLCEMRPHGRDYFDLNELRDAQIMHEARIKKVNEILDELFTESMEIVK